MSKRASSEQIAVTGTQRCSRLSHASVVSPRCCSDGASQPRFVAPIQEALRAIAQVSPRAASHLSACCQRFADLASAMHQFEQVAHGRFAEDFAGRPVAGLDVTDERQTGDLAARVQVLWWVFLARMANVRYRTFTFFYLFSMSYRTLFI